MPLCLRCRFALPRLTLRPARPPQVRLVFTLLCMVPVLAALIAIAWHKYGGAICRRPPGAAQPVVQRELTPGTSELQEKMDRKMR